jgi:branched-chain amino acid transport system ATP-binding protein
VSAVGAATGVAGAADRDAGGRADGRPLLELHGVEASYGPYRALFGVSFTVPEGSVVALVGSNGAGKSTVARVVSGLVRARAGTVLLAGREITRWPAWRMARAGIAHAPEGRSVLATLTVEENLELAARTLLGRRRSKEALDRAFGTFGRLAERRHQLAGTLSGGEQRMLSLAKVLAVPARLLVVDELSLGLSPAVVDEVFGALRAVRDAGTSLLVVEQHVDRALAMADRAVVLVRGRVAAEGAVAEVQPVVARILPERHPAPDAAPSSGPPRPPQQPGG